MARFRFTILNLIVLTVFAALAIAALRQATDLLDSAVFTLAVVLLVVAPLLAIYRSGRKRAYWVGFAVCGTAYLLASLVPALEHRLLTTHALAYLDSKRQALPQPASGAVVADFDSDGSLDLLIGHDLIVTKAQAAARASNTKNAYVDLLGSVATTSGDSTTNTWVSDLAVANSSGWRRVLLTTGGSTEAFVHIGHSLCAVVLAYLGGRLVARLYGKKHSQTC